MGYGLFGVSLNIVFFLNIYISGIIYIYIILMTEGKG